MTTLKINNNDNADVPVRYDASELFPVGRYRSWKTGEVTNPRWLKRQNGFDFITITTDRDLADFEKYLARDDVRLAVEFFNVFSTGTDRNGNPMLVLSDMDDTGDMQKRAIVVIPTTSLALQAVALADRFCGECEAA